MSIDDYPVRAKDGMTNTLIETYLKLVAVSREVADPVVVKMVAEVAAIPVEARETLVSALRRRKMNLQDTLRQQVMALYTLEQQERQAAD